MSEKLFNQGYDKPTFITASEFLWPLSCIGWSLWHCDRSVVSSTSKTDRHDITEILLKVALNTINQTNHDISQMIDYISK